MAMETPLKMVVQWELMAVNPLVNIQITMENHNFQLKNSLLMATFATFHIYVTYYQRVDIRDQWLG